MKKIFIGVAGAIVFLIAAALIVPGFIDWNDYKDEIAGQAGAFTGRALDIGGDIELTLLPAPALVATDVRLANIDGAADADMIRLKSLEIRVALGPLLSGEIQVGKVKLVEPVVHLEILADGRKNWEFAGPNERSETLVPGSAPGKSADAGDGAGLSLAVRLDSVEIENGVVVFRDSAAGTTERIDALNATVSATSLQGPFEFTGRFRARDIPLGLRFSVGEIVEQRAVPITMTLTTDPGASRVALRGIVRSPMDSPSFEGRITAEGKSLAGLIQTAVPGALPGFLGQAFDVDGEVTASGSDLAITELSVRLGETRATGALSAKFGDEISADGQLAAGRIDLDSWLAMPTVAGRSARTADGAGSKKVPRSGGAAGPSAKSAAAAFRLPTGINVSAAVSADAIIYRGGIVRRTRANADLSGGEITISQISALLPGGSEVALFGFVTAPDGTPQFDGEIEAKSADLLGVLDWLGVDTSGVPPGRLRTFVARSKLSAYPELVQARNIDVQVDGSRLTGGVTWAISKRLAFGADLTIDRFNIDAYLPRVSADGSGQATTEAAASKGEGGSPSALAVLDSFDANLRVHVVTLTYKGVPIKDVIVDTTLFDGAVQVHRASIADFGGASVNIAGMLYGLGDEPEMKALTFELNVPDAERLLRVAGIRPPPQARTLGALSVTGRAEGALSQPVIDVDVQAAGGEIALDGTLNLLPSPRFGGQVALRRMDMVRLLEALAVDYRPSGPIGAIDLTGQLDGNASEVSIRELAGTIGDVAIEGSLAASFRERRPKITADLTTGKVVVDPFLPAKRTAAMTPRLVPVSWRPVSWRPMSWRPAPPPRIGGGHELRLVAATPHRRWSREPIDLRVLQSFDADVRLKSEAVAYQGYTLENADLAVTLAAGVLTAERLTGALFDGPLAASGRLDATGSPRLEGSMKLENADLGRATRAVTGKSVATGRMAADARLTTRGQNVAAMVSALDGSGSVALAGVETTGGAQGTVLAPLLALFDGLNRIGGLLGQGAATGAADFSATYSIEDGVVRSEDMRLDSGLGTGAARGFADLPAWRIDVKGELQLARNVVTGLVTEAGSQQPQILPFWLRGPLDAPDVKVDTSSLTGSIRIPGLDKLRKKKGVGKVLDALTGRPSAGAAQPRPTEPPSTDAATESPPDRRPSPLEDALKGLLKNR